ncbi:MAG: aminotransferase class I/II-fold pyridoxal phosphate-dependent enzyme [Myxococcales bacterium]|nr:aminotransferase class I/II-fold pyridoxal phosphate-dependent enzyme [Myxococcales bacterium]
MIDRIDASSALQIAASFESAIRSGKLRPGERIPTVRELAISLDVSPTTVSSAYRELRERRLVIGEGRRGTRVQALPSLRTPAGANLPPGVRDLATGNPDPALLAPLARALRRVDPTPGVYAEQHIHGALREIACEDLEKDGIAADHVAVVSGALDGIDRALQAHLRPGDRVAVEDPGFANLLDLVAALQLDPVPVRVDDRGPLPEALASALAQGARALVVTPRAQNPMGCALDGKRVRALRRVLRDHPEVLLVEDDHSTEVAGAPPATLVARSTRRWAVLRSVSKTLGPDLRVAWMSGDAETMGRIEDRQRVGFRWVSHLLQQIVVELWRDPAVKRRIAKAEKSYRVRRESLLGALRAGGVAAHGESGMNVWIPVREEGPVLQSLLAAGFAAVGGARFRLESPPAVRVTTATLRPGEAERIAAAVREAVGESNSATVI